MRSTAVTGSLFLSAAALVLLPALDRRADGDAVAATVSVAQDPPALLPPRAAPPAWLVESADLVRRGDWEGAVAMLLRSHPEDEAARAVLLSLQGETLVRAGRLAEAKAPLEEAAALREAQPQAGARALFRLAEMAEAEGNERIALDLLEDVRHVDPRSALADEAAERAVALLLHGDPSQALERAAALPVPTDDDEVAARRTALLARAASLAGDVPRHDAAMRRLFYDMPTTAAARELAADSWCVAEPSRALAEGRAEDLLGRVDRLLEADRGREALPEADRILAARPSGPLRATALLDRGRALRLLGRSSQAVAPLQEAASADAPTVSCRAAWQASRAFESLRRPRDARRSLEAAARGCACAWRDRAALELADEAAQGGDVAAARATWERIAATSPDESTRRAASWRRAWSLFGDGDEAALAAFEDVIAMAPTSGEAAAASFWEARLLRDRGDGEQAAARMALLAHDFPLEYYGITAGGECGLGCQPLPECGRADKTQELHARLLAMRDEEAARRVELLQDMGLTDEALIEVRFAAPEGEAGRREARACEALLLSLAGRSREAVHAFRDAVPDWRTRRDVPAPLLCAGFPFDHDALLLSGAGASGVDPALLLGLVHQESAFDETAISHAGARGLMQVMPATGQTIAHWLGERLRTSALLDPQVNVRYGTTYLRRLLDDTGSVEVALAGYNAGPSRARRWWDDTPAKDTARFVESIPIEETRNYVKAIVVNRALYEQAWLEPLARVKDSPARLPATAGGS
jgi:soluble lytic murein transglycosylase